MKESAREAGVVPRLGVGERIERVNELASNDDRTPHLMHTCNTLNAMSFLQALHPAIHHLRQ
jgi:hypothetical protein